MKKLFIAGEITTELSIEEINKILQQIGVSYCPILSLVDVKEVPAERKEIVLYASTEEEENFRLGGPYREEISDELSDKIREFGICTEIKVILPRIDRYGIPLDATDFFAPAVAEEYGFAVAANVQLTVEDNGDDSPQVYYFWISVPADLEVK